HQHYHFIPLSNLHQLIQSLSKHKHPLPILPIQNSIQPTINILPHSLPHHHLYPHPQIQLHIHFSLYPHHSNSLHHIHKLYSIPPPISQTINYIHPQHF
ncbi:prephenate dehydratase domain-containing protein, partial [Staphylococcus epidermidis]|uniref:prephenate dehydratase domain-containing protein n=1 Tax=Staphylococcus epidermidis TaxID=1282 RepID=UPI0028CB56BC